jgi:death on curing protein
VRYLTLAEGLLIAEAVTGISAATHARGPRIHLLDSALNAPRAGFGDEDLYPSLIEKAAVLSVRLAKNHPLLDGNKRLAWQCLVMFLALNGRTLLVSSDEAVRTMLGVASGEIDEVMLGRWLATHLDDD